jgi:hypothetical protein
MYGHVLSDWKGLPGVWAELAACNREKLLVRIPQNAIMAYNEKNVIDSAGGFQGEKSDSIVHR